MGMNLKLALGASILAFGLAGCGGAGSKVSPAKVEATVLKSCSAGIEEDGDNELFSAAQMKAICACAAEKAGEKAKDDPEFGKNVIEAIEYADANPDAEESEYSEGQMAAMEALMGFMKSCMF